MRYDVREVLVGLGYTLHDLGNTFRAKPLYRDSDSQTVLAIDKQTGQWFDFRLNIGGSLESLVKATLGLSTLAEAKERISSNTFIEENRPKSPEVIQTKIYRPEILSKLEQNHSYWQSRGISPEIAKIFEGGVAKAGKMYKRYVFPITNEIGQIFGFAGRLLEDDPNKPKWKLLGPKSQFLYPVKYNHNEIIKEDCAVLVESIGDMLALWQNDVKNTLVTFGLDVNSKIISYLTKWKVGRIIIALNDDSSGSGAGNDASQKALGQLLRHFDAANVSICLPPAKDFGAATPEQIELWKKGIKTKFTSPPQE